jgi:hypothetical protein
MECWSAGVLIPIPLLQYSDTPPLQRSYSQLQRYFNGLNRLFDLGLLFLTNADS